MKFRVTTLWVTCILACASVKAVVPDTAPDPYQAIVDRNVFDLHAPAANVSAESSRQTKPIPKLTLNGITSILGTKLAILTVPATQPRTPPETVMLAEGQAQDEVEVKQINEKSGAVNVINHGEEQTLDFEHDGTKPAPSAATPANPGALQIPPANGYRPNIIRPLRTLQSLPPRAGNEKPFWRTAH